MLGAKGSDLERDKMIKDWMSDRYKPLSDNEAINNVMLHKLWAQVAEGQDYHSKQARELSG